MLTLSTLFQIFPRATATCHLPPCGAIRKSTDRKGRRQTQQVAHCHNRNWQLALLLGIRTETESAKELQMETKDRVKWKRRRQKRSIGDGVAAGAVAVAEAGTGAGMTAWRVIAHIIHAQGRALQPNEFRFQHLATCGSWRKTTRQWRWRRGRRSWS